jgi:hypothetical protein
LSLLHSLLWTTIHSTIWEVRLHWEKENQDWWEKIINIPIPTDFSGKVEHPLDSPSPIPFDVSAAFCICDLKW